MPFDPAVIRRVSTLAKQLGASAMPCQTEIDGLTLVASAKPTTIADQLYTPLVCLVLQGTKEVETSKERLRFGAEQSLIVSHLIPARSRIVDAPYLALAYRIDPQELASLYDSMHRSDIAPVGPITAGETDGALADALLRLFDLLDRPMDQHVILPLLHREIHYRLLMARHGAMLRRLARPDSVQSRIARALGHLRLKYDQPLVVADLANVAGMSLSSFHHHFRQITQTTPLQFQKTLRLIEARRRLQTGDSVSTAAYEVGYESPTQFSREYSRKFGTSPRADRAPA